MRDREQETLQELLRYMEQELGHDLRTREDVDRYLAFLAEVHPQKENRASIGNDWLIAKRVVLVALVAFAVFQYFAVDVVTEVLSVDKVKFLSPPPLPHATRT